MEFSHKSVLLNETIENLNIKEDGIYADLTLGKGGHSKEILKTFIDLAHQANKCIIIVTHSPSLAQKCDVQLKIEDGQIVEI